MVSDPPRQPGPIFLARNAFKICPINSFTSFMLNLHLQESLRPPKRPSKAKNGQKSRFFWSRPKIVGQRGKNWPLRISPMIGELITLKDPPSKVSRLGCRWIPPAKKITSWPIYKFKSIYIQKKFLTKTKCLKIISNHSMVVSGPYFNPFQGSQGPQEGSEAKILTF